jgi:heme-degrading monooxygenase HmoA
MIAVIFEAWPADDRRDASLLAAALRPELEAFDGFISVERFESLSEPGKLLALSFWRDEAAVFAWREAHNSRATQAQDRWGLQFDYRLRIGEVIRDYPPNEGASPAS